jgi:hypothetical protein
MCFYESSFIGLLFKVVEFDRQKKNQIFNKISYLFLRLCAFNFEKTISLQKSVMLHAACFWLASRGPRGGASHARTMPESQVQSVGAFFGAFQVPGDFPFSSAFWFSKRPTFVSSFPPLVAEGQGRS